MGLSPSRGKKVAPVRDVTEVSVTRTAASTDKRDRRVLKPLRVQGGAVLRPAPRDCHSEGPESDCSDPEEEEEEREEEEKIRARKSRSYGLCHFSSRADPEDEGCGARPRGRTRGAGGAAGGNERSSDAFTDFSQKQQQSSSRGVLAAAAPHESEQQSTLGRSASLTLTPVILYDGSEEELMDTIEREFS